MRDASFDLVIVGGGPVGLATGIAAAETGMSAVLVESRRPPVDKACGEGIMPPGVRWLYEHGVDLGDNGFAFMGTKYIEGELVAEGRFRHGPGLGIRRDLLHNALRRRAEALGVTLRWEHRVQALHPAGVRTARGDIAARWVVGADGIHSRVRRWAGLHDPGAVRASGRFGLRRRYAIAPWTDLVEVHVQPDAEAYVTPLGTAEVGVVILSRQPEMEFEPWLDRFDILARRLTSAPTSSADRAAGPFPSTPRGVVRNRVALVGDAAGFLDALTGEGLALGFLQATALVRAITLDSPANYALAHERLHRDADRFTRGMLFLRRHRSLGRLALRLLARQPWLFDRILEWPLRETGPRDGPSRFPC